MTWGFTGSLLLTLMVLVSVPVRPCVLRVTLTRPSPPGGTETLPAVWGRTLADLLWSLSLEGAALTSAAVQPHPAFALSESSGEAPSLRKVKM